MTIKHHLQEDMKLAMKAKERVHLFTIRMAIDRIQKKEKELLRELSEEESIKTLQTFNKQIDEEIEAFKTVVNQSKVDELIASKKVIEKYLPKQMSKLEIEMIVKTLLSDLAKSSCKIDKGSVMKEIMPLVRGKVDNKLLNEIVSLELEGI